VAGYYIPSARYIYPVVIPLLLLFISGWLEIFGMLHLIWLKVVRKQPVSWRTGFPVQPGLSLSLQYTFYLLCFVALDILSVISVAQYYGSL
jgi:hypothetical protein